MKTIMQFQVQYMFRYLLQAHSKRTKPIDFLLLRM